MNRPQHPQHFIACLIQQTCIDPVADTEQNKNEAKELTVLTQVRLDPPAGDSFALEAPNWVLRDRHLALYMSQHHRLGGNSKLTALDAAVMHMIVEYARVNESTNVLAERLGQLVLENTQEDVCKMVSGRSGFVALLRA